jgi:hypothetical protein
MKDTWRIHGGCTIQNLKDLLEYVLRKDQQKQSEPGLTG